MSAPNGMTTLAVPSKPLSPDEYKNYALQDPGFLGLQSALQGNEDAFRANARGGINRGVINLGIAPSDASIAPWLDSGTAATAAANPLSVAANLTTQHQQNVRGIKNSLAARGGYDSGELTYGLGNEDQRDTQARGDAMSKFLDYANGLFSQLGGMQASDAGQLGTELGAAAMRQLALHPGSTTAAQWDDATGTYVDADGNHYDQWGNHIGTYGDSSQPTNFGPAQTLGDLGYTNLPSPLTTSTPAGFNYLPQQNAPPGGPSLPGLAPYTPPDQPIITKGGGTNIRTA